MATSTKHNGFKRLVDRALSATLSNSYSTTDSELAILVNGQEAMAFKPDSVGTYGHTKIGNQPAEATASIIDGYGVSLATGYSASATNRIYALEVNADTGSTDLTGDTNIGAIKARVVAGTTQTNCGISGLIGTLDVGDGVDLISNYNGVCGVVDFYGDSTLGGSQTHVAPLMGVLWNESTTTLNSASGSLSGLELVQVGTATITAGLNPAIYVRGSAWSQTLAVDSASAMHCIIDNYANDKNIRLNSRNLSATSGSHTAVQVKPRGNATGTLAVTGIECSPGLNAGVAGTNIRAICADPLLKAGSGNVTGQVVGVECNIDFGTSGTRTITGDVSAFSTFLAIPSTYTYASGHVSVMRVRDVNIKSWDSFLNIDSDATGVTQAAAAGSGGHLYLKVYVADTLHTIDMVHA